MKARFAILAIAGATLTFAYTPAQAAPVAGAGAIPHAAIATEPLQDVAVRIRYFQGHRYCFYLTAGTGRAGTVAGGPGDAALVGEGSTAGIVGTTPQQSLSLAIVISDTDVLPGTTGLATETGS